MGKFCPKDKPTDHPKNHTNNNRGRRQRLKALNTQRKRNNNKRNKEYVKPGALAHRLRCYTRTTTKAANNNHNDLELLLQLHNKDVHLSTPPPVMTPEKIFSVSPTAASNAMATPTPMPMLAPLDHHLLFLNQSTPKTPRLFQQQDSSSESRLESLPIDILVKILCLLHHDQLRPVFHVSQKIRKAVLIARQFYFNYTTPDRARQEMLRTMTPLPAEHWPFVNKGGNGKGIQCSSPNTPKAPRHGPRPPRYKGVAEVRQIAAVLFQESAFTSRCIVPPGLPKPVCKSFASNRALFCEDELCQAVAQNKLR